MSLGTSPDVDNLYIGRGIISFQREGAGVFTDLGEVPEVELTLNITMLDYFSSRVGVRTKVKSIVLEKGGQIRIRMDEWSAYNAQLVFLGPLDMANPLGPTVDIMADDQIEGQLKFHGTNDVGPNWDMHLNKVQIRPTRSVNLINERDWGGMEITGELLRDETIGSFGTMTMTNFGDTAS